ncbi:hypothetical protein C1645_838505 [Glomus cerebriforme]|uniref:Uncharacterized protein n=1 Tax=Glomus cerebriforme TaxID=658196 RepID=A0A397S2D2_9GLOM|nr:hypothetical protein C1645_838505 [Glomus cerebriforme]
MTASFLLSECLENIFSNLLDKNICNNKSIKDLYSCTLVSRYWCRISTPFLYEYPFHHFYYKYPDDAYFKLIRTLLSCIPKSEIEQIISSNTSNIQKLLSYFFRSNIKSYKPTFNYISFIRGLIFNDLLGSELLLFCHRKIWLPPYISKNQAQFQLSVTIIDHLLKFLCKHCNNITVLDTTKNKGNNIFNMIELLTYKGSNGRSKLNDLKELYYADSVVHKKDIYLTLSNNNICNLTLLYNEGFSFINSLSQFISLQKKLKHIILSENLYEPIIYDTNQHYSNKNTVFNSLSTQSKSLQTLEFKYLLFSSINQDALNSLRLLENIRELKLYECMGVNDKLIPWAKSLTKLEVFEFVTYHSPSISEEFLIQLIQSSSNTLIKLIVNYGRRERQRTQLFKQIPTYLKSLVHLDLPKTYPDELISIFGSCTKLIYLGIILPDFKLWIITFKNLGKFIPKNLQKIRFNGMNNSIFNCNELKSFLEGCVNNGKNLKYLEIIGKCELDKKYFDIAEEFGIILNHVHIN